MSELPRRIVSRLRRFVGNRRHSRRVRARLSFTLSLSEPPLTTNGHRRLPSLDGYTLDVSATGLALVVPAIRIGEHYLAGDERKLHIQLELPAGPLADAKARAGPPHSKVAPYRTYCRVPNTSGTWKLGSAVPVGSHAR